MNYLSSSLERLGVRNIVLCATPTEPIERKPPFILKLLPIRVPSPSTGFIGNLLFMMSYGLLSFFWAIIVFSRSRVSLIHCHSPAITGIVGVLVSKILRIPIIYTVHGLAGPPHRWTGYRGNMLDLVGEVFTLRHSSAVITISEDYIKAIHPIVSKEIFPVGNGVDTSTYHPVSEEEKKKLRDALDLPQDTPLMLWVGNFDLQEKVKGVIDIFTALDHIVSENALPWLFLLAGSGQFQEELQSIVDKKKLTERVHFLGYCDNIVRYYQAADIFVLVSHHEGSPNALLEAMASGMICIGSRVGAIDKIIGEEGYVVTPGQPMQLAQVLKDILTNKEKQTQLSRAARARAESKLGWNTISKKTREIYANILN